MKVLVETFAHTGNLHHAYAIVGDRRTNTEALAQFLKSVLRIEKIGNPDYSELHFETFSIDDSRELGERQRRMSFEGKKIFVVAFDFITQEAQNALLKVLEEPTLGTHIFLVVPSADLFLPTVISRLVVINERRNGASSAEAKAFLKMMPGERLAFAKEIVEEKNKQSAMALLNGLEAEFHGHIEKGFSDHRSLNELLIAKRYMYSRSPSLKLLLEHLALVLPVV